MWARRLRKGVADLRDPIDTTPVRRFDRLAPPTQSHMRLTRNHDVASTAYCGSLICRRGTAKVRGPVRPGDRDLMPIWSRGFPRNLEAAGEARAFIRQVLGRRIPHQVLDDVLLMTSELAINSARHVPSDRGDWLEVLVDHGDELLRVSVRDPGTDFDSNDIARAQEVGGWGLQLVNGLSSRWGVVPSSEGTAVWFEIDRPPGG